MIDPAPARGLFLYYLTGNAISCYNGVTEAVSFHRNEQMTKTELRAKLEATFTAMDELMEAFEQMPANSLDVEDDLDILAMLADVEMVRNGLIQNSSVADEMFEEICEKEQVQQA